MEKENDIIYDLESLPENTIDEGGSNDGNLTPDGMPDDEKQSPADEEAASDEEHLLLGKVNMQTPETGDSKEKVTDNEEAEKKEDTEKKKDDSDPENKKRSRAESEIQRMIDDMGANRVLEIIRDNRNEAIRQILSEIEASQVRVMPSGRSIIKECNSIFDLAAMA